MKLIAGVDIGNSTTEVCIMSMNGVVAARTMRTGSLALDEAIMRYIRREKKLIIGQNAAGQILLGFSEENLHVPGTEGEFVYVLVFDKK